jgi:hypothetical protein
MAETRELVVYSPLEKGPIRFPQDAAPLMQAKLSRC